MRKFNWKLNIRQRLKTSELKNSKARRSSAKFNCLQIVKHVLNQVKKKESANASQLKRNNRKAAYNSVRDLTGKEDPHRARVSEESKVVHNKEKSSPSKEIEDKIIGGLSIRN